jgi:hypothetical protein
LSAPLRRSAAAVLVALASLGATAAPGGAATVAPDYQTAVRDIIFPVAGKHTYTDTFGACRSGCTRGHEGTDIMAAKLTPLVAARDTTVSWLKDTATPDGTNGNYLMLRDSQGWEYWYIHINNDSPGTDDGANPEEWIFGPGIVRGAAVKAGQLVAYVGDSGNAERAASHLHFEIHKPDGTIINPYKSLNAAPRLPSPVSGGLGVTEADESFVKALAVDFLGRSSTEAELDRDLFRIAAGTPRSTVVETYAGSQEWVSALVAGYYESTLGRPPDPGGSAYWVDKINRGMTPAAVAARFYASAEYFAASGGTNDAWVTDLYEEILHRAPDPGGLGHWSGKADTGTSRTVIAADFYGSLESRRTRVTALYHALLGRAPDPGGLDHWATRLRNGRDIELAVMLASSTEYYLRASARSDLG